MSAESERRTVTPLTRTHRDGPMNAVGLVLAVLIGLVMLPLLPVVALVWLAMKLFG
jgi:hypothetical protein